MLERKEKEKRRGEIGNGHHRQLTGDSGFPIGASRAEMTQPVCARISNNFTSLLHYDESYMELKGRVSLNETAAIVKAAQG